MKNQWPFWLFVIGIIIVIFISMNYQGQNKAVSLGDIFPEEEQVNALDYEYVTDPMAEQTVVQDTIPGEPASSSVQTIVKNDEKTNMVVEEMPVSIEKSESQSVGAVKSGSYTIQILASKDKSAMEAALKKAQKQGLNTAYIQFVDLGAKGAWYRMYVGSYQTKADADKMLAGIDKANYAGAFVIKL